MTDTIPRLPSARDEEPEDRGASPAAVSRREPLWRHMLGEQLRQLRHERGETLGETARNARVSPQYLSEIERGVKDPSSEMIAAVAGALDVTLIDLTVAVAEHLTFWRASNVKADATQSAFALAA